MSAGGGAARPDPERRVFWDGRRPAPPGWDTDGPRSTAELLADGLPHPTGSADQVYVGPGLGEVPQWDLVEVLVEFRRVLRVGGLIRVAAFDVDAAISAYTAGEAGFFWDDSWDALAGRMAGHVLGWGSARSLLTTSLLEEVLGRAGFADVRAEAFGSSRAGPALAAPDRFAEHCCHVEARNPTPWPTSHRSDRPTGVHLAWADPGCRSMDVLWSAPAGSEGAVRHRLVGEQTWTTVAASGQHTIDGPLAPWVFRATCPELVRGGEYEYEVVQRQDGEVRVTPRSSFRALPAPGSAIRFAFVADTGISGRPDGLSDGTRRVVRAVRDLAPHLVLCGGDYAYRSSDPRLVSGQQAVHAWLAEMEPVATRCPLLVQYGNHEVGLGERHRDWAVHFPQLRTEDTHGSRSASVDAGPCHVVAFYAPTEDIAPDETAWLWQDLAAARDRGCRWLVVFQHQPLLAHGSSHPADGRVERALARVLAHHRVDLHLSAHDQNYERTHPVTWHGEGVVRVSRPVEPGRPGRVPQGAGVVLAKVSPAGRRSDRGGAFSALPRELPPVVATADDTGHHFAVIDVDDARLELRTFSLAGADAPPECIDHLVIESTR